ncbi:HEAT repeat domain-containing protein [Catellatospora tritici]|uniref:HEAT repeat domain-containing protein n=1 Tax=Catellatospora tritici TaxID=2851566 RepID=UPI001C2D9917|nr:HEAT repeat domain-containing protein [Catellatospora tritici]MBV1851247.1 HEAT repeat domain-containing protein [Catellatospora tritici]
MNPDQRALKDGDLDTREEHLYRLLDRARAGGDESALAALRLLTRDYPNYHRSLYSRAMNQADVFVDASLAEPLLAALADTRYNCQAWAAMGCAALRLPAAVPGLLALLERGDWMGQEQAVRALGRIGDKSAVPALVPLLWSEPEWLREHAADALASIGGEEALAALWDAFEHRGFTRIGYLASALAKFTPEIIPRLLAVADDDDPDLRYWAAIALGSTGDEQVVPTLERLMAQDKGRTVFDGWVSVAAKKALRTQRRIQAAIVGRAESGRASRAVEEPLTEQ